MHIDNQLLQFNNILDTAATSCLKIKSIRKSKSSKMVKKNKPWFTNDCKYLKKRLKQMARRITPSNYNSLKNEYFKLKKDYKKLVKRNQRKYKNEILSKIQNLNSKDSSGFWKQIKVLNGKEQIRTSPLITEENWIEHFKTLLYTEDTVECQETLNVNSTQNAYDLDRTFTDAEIQNHISKLKCNKASGIDNITNEMIKSGRFYLVPFIKKIFNNILMSGQFPKVWNIGLIKPIYKKGDQSLPANYRGITLTSCLGKLFTSILQSRLQHFLESNDILNPEQFGFRSNSRTTDNLFILKQLIHKYLSSKQNLYVCFVDYEKAFDSVWQSGLLHKIKAMGINGKFYNVLKSMYTSISSSVILENNKISESFKCNKGIRQGDGLSPVLFSIFMNDLPEYLRKSGCKGVEINNNKLNCLMYADDLVLISNSAKDLQHSINTLNKHADKWKLKINTSKTNIMVFNKAGRFIEKETFKCNDQHINIVDKQTYLGLDLTPSGRFTYARGTLVKKGTKVLATIRRMLSNCDHIPVETFCKLFNSIEPVIFYGSEVWGPELLEYKTHFDKSTIEQFHLKFCKLILNIPGYAPNDACRAELGRTALDIKIKTLIFSYYLRLQNNVTNRLLKNAFEYATNKQTDFNNVCHRLNLMRQDTLITKIKTKTEMKLERKMFFNQLVSEYKDSWSSKINAQSNQKITGKTIKSSYEMEQYLNIVKNQAHRKSITKMRLGTHDLRIQTGKYENNKAPIPVDQRICRHCQLNEIENEEHFIGHCETFKHIRHSFFSKISDQDPNFQNLNLSSKIKYILKANNTQTANLIGKFLYTLIKERSGNKLITT